MKKKLLCLILCLMSSLTVVGCKNQTNRVETDEEIQMPDEDTMGETADLYEAVEQENLEELGEVVVSEDGVYQVLVPSGWVQCKNKIDDSMLFELQGKTEDQYMGIMVLDAASYGDFDISTFVDTYAENAKEQYGNAVVGQKEQIDVNGHTAYALRISGSIDEIAYINHVCAVKYAEEIVIFTASTYQTNEDLVRSTLIDVVFSFGRVATEETMVQE